MKKKHHFDIGTETQVSSGNKNSLHIKEGEGEWGEGRKKVEREKQ